MAVDLLLFDPWKILLTWFPSRHKKGFALKINFRKNLRVASLITTWVLHLDVNFKILIFSKVHHPAYLTPHFLMSIRK